MDRTLQGTRKLRCAIYTRKSTEDGLVDVIVVYKIDRLSRALMDYVMFVSRRFAKAQLRGICRSR